MKTSDQSEHPHTTVLVVDDESMVREIATEILRDADYGIVEAADADEALRALNDHPEVEVLFTDITMPGRRDGLALAREVHKRRPDICVIVTSGKGAPAQGDMPEGSSFIPKPYTEATILRAIARGCC